MLTDSILRTALSHRFWKNHSDQLDIDLFDTPTQRDIYRTIATAHERVERDLRLSDLVQTYVSQHPTATQSNRQQFEMQLGEIQGVEPIADDLVPSVLADIKRTHTGRQVSLLALRLAEGDQNVIAEIQEAAARLDNIRPSNIQEPTTLSLKEIIEEQRAQGALNFNITGLDREIPQGMHKGQFGCMFAVPNAGKTALVLTLAVGPGGYCDQGFKVLIVGNEEVTKFTVARAYSCAYGLTKEQLEADLDNVTEQFQADYGDRLFIHEATDWDFNTIEEHIAYHEADAVFIDQLDKVQFSGNYGGTHEKLGAIYQRAREVAKKHNCLLIGVGQANNEAQSKTLVTYEMMAGSRTSKAAEADFILGVGKKQLQINQPEDYTRYLTVSKNKLNGWHGTVVCTLNAEWSRYDD